MKIICSTNIDAYKGKFSRNFSFIPRAGEKVRVDEVQVKQIEKLRLPTELTVVAVTHSEEYIRIELHYSETDVMRAKVCDINLFP